MSPRPASPVPALAADDLWRFGEGTHDGLAYLLGAHAGADGTTCRVWAPSARSVSVVGDFDGWSGDGVALPRRRPASGPGVWTRPTWVLRWRRRIKVAETSFIFQLASLEVSRLKPIWRFLNGDYHSVEKFKGKIEGLSDHSIDLWHADYNEFLHAVLRGNQLEATDVHRLGKEFALGETEILLDMNLAARFVRRRLEARDFADSRAFEALLCGDVPDYSKVNARHLNFKRLIFVEVGLVLVLISKRASLTRSCAASCFLICSIHWNLFWNLSVF